MPENMLKEFAICVLLIIVCQCSSSHGDESTQELRASSQAIDGQMVKGRLFAGAYSTILRTSVITSTTATDYYTCWSTLSSVFGCSGRRKRRNVKPRHSLHSRKDTSDSLELAASTSDDLMSSMNEEKARFMLTIYTTSTTTVTLSTKSINLATTVSIDYYCTTSGMSTYPMC